MNPEDIVITKIISGDSYQEVISGAIRDTFFFERRPIFQFIQTFYSDHGAVPKLDIIQDNFPNWKPIENDNPVSYWIDKLRKNRSLAVQSEFIEDWMKKRKDGADADDLSVLLNKMSSQILEDFSTTTDINLKDVDTEWEYYQEVKEKGTLGAIPLGLSKFDVQNGGALPGELGIIIGPPKSMKTWDLVWCAWNAWVKSNKTVLLVSKEMSEVQIRNRMAFFDTLFSYPFFKRGELGEVIEKEYKRALDKRADRKDFWISADEDMGEGVGGVNLVSVKIDLYKPDIVFVDGGYFLVDDRGGAGWEQIRNVYRDLKKLARRKQVPIVVTHQPQRLKEKDGSPLKRKLTLEDVGMAYTLSQDCDWMIGIRRISRSLVQMYIIGMREGEIADWQMMFDLDNGRVQEIKPEDEILDDEFSDDLQEETKFD